MNIEHKTQYVCWTRVSLCTEQTKFQNKIDIYRPKRHQRKEEEEARKKKQVKKFMIRKTLHYKHLNTHSKVMNKQNKYRENNGQTQTRGNRMIWWHEAKWSTQQLNYNKKSANNCKVNINCFDMIMMMTMMMLICDDAYNAPFCWLICSLLLAL